MTISFYKELTRNSEIGCTPVLVLPNIWRLGRVRNTKFGTNVFNKMLLNAAKCQDYNFYSFWVIMVKLTGGWGVKLPPSPRWGLMSGQFKSFERNNSQRTAESISQKGKTNPYLLDWAIKELNQELESLFIYFFKKIQEALQFYAIQIIDILWQSDRF